MCRSASDNLPPGPKARFPFELLLKFRKDPLGYLTNLRRQYGDVVRWRVGPNWYHLLGHPDHIHRCLVTDAAKFTKGPALQRASITLGRGLLTSEGDAHRRQRRLAQPAFHPRRVEAYAATMVAHAKRFAASWQHGQTLDAHREMMALTLSVVAEALFGADVGGRVHAIGHAMDTSVTMFTRAMLPWGALLAALPLPSNYRFLRARRLLFDTIQQMIDARRASPAERDDFLSILLRAPDPEGGAGMSDQQVRDECVTLFMAGHETTANLLTFTLHLLAKHPDARETLLHEIESVVGRRDVTAADVEHLTYARHVLAESMRVFPPVWTVGRRAREDWEVAGHVIPAGGVVLSSQWVTHHDERFWHDPHRFAPNRWAGDAGGDRPRWSYFPFGGGPRNCIGEPFAWLEGTLLLVTLLQHGVMDRLDDGELALEPTITLRPRGGLRMRWATRGGGTR